MSDAKQKLRRKWQLVLGISVLFLVVLIVQDIIREVVVFNRNIQILETEFERDIQDDVYTLVQDVDTEFSQIYSRLYDLTVAHSKEHTETLLYAAETVQSLLSGESLSFVQNSIVELTQSYNLDDGNHVFSVYETNGHIRYDGFNDLILDIDHSTVTDDFNRLYVETILSDTAQSPTNEVTMLYYKEEDDEISSYVIYGKEIESSNLIIVGFVKISRYNEILKTEAIDALSEKYNDGDNSVYVLTREGEILYHQNANAIGISTQSDEYPLWQETLIDIREYVLANNEGYIEYPFYSNYNNGVIEDKIAYVTYIEDWDIIIGASSSYDIYQSLLDDYILDNYLTVMWIKLPSYLIIFSMAVFLALFIKKNIDMSESFLQEDEKLYRTFADMTSEIIMITDKQGKIIFTNKKGKDIIYGQREVEDEVFFDQILVEEDGYFILYGVKEDLFVKFITEQILYNNHEADLYIIANVTDKVQTKRQLEALSMKDDLTGLGNRRMLVQDYNQIILPHIKQNGNAHLVMIDLDDFKPANDLYGHTFGDEVLQEIAMIFKEVMDDKLKIYRIGGDEFAMLVMDMTQAEIEQTLKHLQLQVAQHPYQKEIEVGFSGGVVNIEITANKRRFSDFYDKADKLLYKSKDAGKNTIHF